MAGVTMTGCEKNLMVVDDDHLIREQLSLLLQGEGYHVREAGDGQEALDQLRQGPVPDCILLDLRMPRMDGRQFRSRQSHDPRLASIPVLLISGESRVAEEAAFMGVADYLQKPFQPDALLRALHHVC
jgi:CheY-like chemotaxis protein